MGVQIKKVNETHWVMLSPGRAEALFDAGVEIFKLYPDGTEALVTNRNDLSTANPRYSLGWEVLGLPTDDIAKQDYLDKVAIAYIAGKTAHASTGDFNHWAVNAYVLAQEMWKERQNQI